ncbi:MFS transporter [Leucobacter luti]|uniref:Putative MFS family arabinose efflux permease n=1 Tax=Leucobacter luti TaxID=340320 RepID=A0A4Q7U4F5_9MICO|nr:MFS transporter [Leucobacter luti]MBL3700760.1 MFS transporter [Leucobacter luti]RZT68403.1 putative MFS family arabinose efflux permease [Leucobacter luti]
MTTPKFRPAAGTKPLSSIIIVWVYAFLPANLIPGVIGRLVNDFGMDVTLAGLLATGMTLLNSATVLAVRPFVRRGFRVPLAMLGAILLIVVCGIGIAFPTPAVIGALLLVAGVGSGLALAAASASISATPQPERSTNIAMIFNRLIVAVAYFLVPIIGTSIETILLLIGLPGVVVLLTARWLPSAPRVADTDGQPVSAARAGRQAWLLAAGMGILAVTDDGVIGISEVIGIGFFGESGSALVLNLYAIAILAGLVGALVAPAVSRWLGRVGALTLALALSLLGKILILVLPNVAAFSGGYIVWGFAFGLCLPVIFGIAAAMRADGSASVAVNAVYVLGVALGPTVAAQVFDLGGTPALAAVMGVLGVLASALMIAVTARIPRAAMPQREPVAV